MTTFYAIYRISDGVVIGRGQCPEGSLQTQSDPSGASNYVEVSEALFNTLEFGLNKYRLENGSVVPLPVVAPVQPTLAQLKFAANLRIDNQAEAARLAFITGGSGQSMEYQATEVEGRYILADVAAGRIPNPVSYPFVSAELTAYLAVGQAKTLVEVAQEVIGLSDAWAQIGSTIKAIRRTAKLRVEQATTPAEVFAAASQIVWPSPGTP